MSIRISDDFIHGMKFTQKKKYKEFYSNNRVNTVEIAWVRTGKQLKKAIKDYDGKTGK